MLGHVARIEPRICRYGRSILNVPFKKYREQAHVGDAEVTRRTDNVRPVVGQNQVRLGAARYPMRAALVAYIHVEHGPCDVSAAPNPGFPAAVGAVSRRSPVGVTRIHAAASTLPVV